jgi:putative endopeptidase
MNTDLKQFQDHGACVADQFDQHFIEDGVPHNGKMVLGESVGNPGWASVVYLAYQKSLEGKPRPADIDGFTPEQQFFIALGQCRGDDIRIEQHRVIMQNDPHPVARCRVNGPLSNLPEFQKAFSCKADAPMVRRRPDRRCDVR